MSSWFSYIRSSIIGDELPSTFEAGVVNQIGPTEEDTLSRTGQSVDTLSQHVDTLSTCSATAAAEQKSDYGQEDSITPSHGNSSLPAALSQEQREHIKNVLRRAERSGRNAKVVVDSRHLKRCRHSTAAAQTTTTTACAPSIGPRQQERHEQQKTNEDEEDQQQEGQFIVQMDSLPEDVEVSVGPYSYCSYASSELSYSEADKGYSSAVTEEPDGAAAGEKAAVNNTAEGGEDGRKSIAQKMQKLSKKIDQWLKSLDKEDSELEQLLLVKTTGAEENDSKKGTMTQNYGETTTPPTPLASATEAEEEENSRFCSIIWDTLAQSICCDGDGTNPRLELANDVIHSVAFDCRRRRPKPSESDDGEVGTGKLLLKTYILLKKKKRKWCRIGRQKWTFGRKSISMVKEEEDEELDSCYTILIEEMERPPPMLKREAHFGINPNAILIARRRRRRRRRSTHLTISWSKMPTMRPIKLPPKCDDGTC
ncbi:hypothetical protein niasHT_018836 [Heterodera trifolii]|uniref:Uncharacterized protein n=1 Tax=Heterodera trifolii TaxID=157864 RepID=A0ABD2L3B3_9BILA